MIQHLTDDQISSWVLGKRSRTENQHMSQCGECALELNNFRAALDVFGAALRGEADHRAASQDLTLAGVSRSAAANRGLFASGALLDAASPEIGSSRALSFALHAMLVVLLMLPVAAMKTPAPTETSVVLLSPPAVGLQSPRSGGGGGGGTHSLTPPSRGLPPRGADKQIVPPMVEAKNLMPELAVEPTIVAPQLSQLTPFNFSTIGDLNGVVGPPSAGPGRGGGIGTGDGRGVGDGRGPGLGPGEGGGVGGGAYQVGGGITAPRIVRQTDPEYSEAGRKARAQGTVELMIIVREDGSVDFVDLVKRLGFGLDERAIAAVRTWAFEPGRREGIPVPVYVNVVVNFTLR